MHLQHFPRQPIEVTRLGPASRGLQPGKVVSKVAALATKLLMTRRMLFATVHSHNAPFLGTVRPVVTADVPHQDFPKVAASTVWSGRLQDDRRVGFQHHC
jgi:hypothetical protein